MSQAWDPRTYAPMAAYLMPAAEVCVRRLGSDDGVVLDVATGTGNGIVAAATRGRRVIGVDSSAAQLAVARERCPGAELIEADASALPLPDDHVDAGISLFGLIFAADPDAALRELVRCVRPGGRVGVTALSDDGWPARARELLARHAGVPAPRLPAVWADPERARTAATRAGLTAVEVTWEPLTWPFPVDAVTRDLVRLAALRARAEAAGTWPAARAELESLLGPGPLVDHYVLVTGTVGPTCS